jgi:biopolymer transport protein ExbD
MGKFGNKEKAEMPELNTSSLPDLIFSILFFFMIVTTMREEEVIVDVKLPKGSERVLTEIEHKSSVINVYVGVPTKEHDRAKHGDLPCIQLNDKISGINDVREFVTNGRKSMKQVDQARMKVALKVNETANMGIVTDVKMELRKAGALNVLYSADKLVVKE